MRVLRPALAVAAVATVLTGVGANAVTKPVCNLGTDAAEDANGTPLLNVAGVGPSAAAYDITSFDVASNAKTVTTVLRVKQLSEKSQLSPTGIQWNVQFEAFGTTFQTLAHATSAGKSAELDTVDLDANTYEKVADALLVFDTAKNEVRISVPASLIGKLVAGKTKLTNLNATGGRFYDVSGVVSATDATDVATTDKTYTAGALSCVKPGK